MKKLITILITFILIFNLTTIVFAQTLEDEYAMTASYMPQNVYTRSIIDEDDRLIIEDTANSPYLAIARLTLEYSCDCTDGNSGSGTGFMVSQNCMLTAGHCIVCEDCGEEMSSITARFGYDKDTSTSRISITATPDDSIFYHNPNYPSSPNYDCGYVVFESDVGDLTGWFGLSSKSDSSLNGLLVNVTGYKGGNLYHCSDYVTDVSSTRVYYEADTEPGQSGSPVYNYSSSYGNQVVAIHTRGTFPVLIPDNSGWRITTAFINELDSLGYVNKVE